tara:strand:- start:349 stop:720 length:372 start_codon:yes stop_codon:yes gene_type:complete
MKRSEIVKMLDQDSDNYISALAWHKGERNLSFLHSRDAYPIAEYSEQYTLGTVEKKIREHLKDFDDVIEITVWIKVYGHKRETHFSYAKKLISRENTKVSWQQVWSIEELIEQGLEVKTKAGE